MRNLTVLLLCMSCSHLNTPVKDPTVVAVRATNGWCSGVWTRPNEVSTAAHCVNESPGVFAQNQHQYTGAVIADRSKDPSQT